MLLDILYWIGIAAGVLAALILLIALAGLFFAKGHVVNRSLSLQQTPETIWQAVSDFANVPSWWGMVTKAEQPKKDEPAVWRETYTGNYGILLRTTEFTPPKRLVRTIADEKGPFRGRWEYDIVPNEQGSTIIITEHGEIPNPFFRFMARMFMDPAMYIEMYLKALAKKFNETAVPEKTVAKQPAPTDNTAKTPEVENQAAANQESRTQP
jgi:uncharacterized protein YndB with AHSA1/START domain